jgi:glucose/arabinose dehydrogenase
MLVAVVLLAGCASASPSGPRPSGVQPVSTPTQIVGGLEAPWSMVRLETGSTLISERDSGTIVELTADGALRDVGRVTDAVHDGEGGLLGLEVVRDSLYAYVTTADDNRIERFDLLGEAGSYSLGDSAAILTGIRKAGNHNGGRIKLGPDGMLYATVGDAGDRGTAQDPNSLNGKILRMQLDGSAPADNPFDGSLVYSLGHRNPQGLAWDADGQLWAAEFGQDTWDEFNRIEAGANYGWPVVEGMSDDPHFVNPEYQWPTDDASPSGLAFTDGTFFLAALRGSRLWVLYPDRDAGVDAVAYFEGEYGRIRDVVPGPDGTLWMLTNNTDGRGSPQQGDDRIIQVALSELVEG